MAELKNMPAIRFKGFSEDWEEKQIADLCSETTGGGTPKTTESKYWNGDIPWLQSSDLVENQLSNVVYRKTITEHGLKSSATKLVPADSIAIITRVGVGKLALIPYQYSTSQDFLSLSNLKIDKWFGTYSIWKKIQSELHAVQGTSIKGITKEELLSKKALIPKETDEQTQIGSYFQHFDKLISLHQAKVNKLTNLKKAMLEKMLPKQGADVPEVRFKGFAGAWDEKSLGDEVADIVGGGTPNTFEPTYWNGDIDWYSPTEIGTKVFADGSVKKITELGLHNSSAKLLPANKTILFTSRAGIGDMAILRRIGATNQGFQSIVLKDGYDPYFIYSMGHIIKDYAIKYSSGSTFLEISGKILGRMVIKVPSLTEQEKIGTYFHSLDKTITLHENELEKLNNLKKACLEKMFV